MAKYEFVGAVMHFDKCIAYIKHAETIAPSEAKARSNIAYRWKKENGYGPNQKIRLQGNLILKEDTNG